MIESSLFLEERLKLKVEYQECKFQPQISSGPQSIFTNWMNEKGSLKGSLFNSVHMWESLHQMTFTPFLNS